MLRRTLVCLAFALAFLAFTPDDAQAQSCGGPGEVPCYHWDWCAYTTPSIFGPVCWGGLVPSTPWAGCSNDRLNNWGLVCVPCGSPFEPTCAYGPVCDTDQRYTAFGLCYPCGQTGQAVCTSGAACDVGNRAVFGFCSYSGFSNEPTTNVASMPTLTQPATGPVRGIADLHTHQFANLGFGGVVFWGAPYDARGINHALPWCDYTWEFSTNLPPVPSFGYEVHGPTAFQALTHPLSNAIEEGAHNVGGTGPFDGWPTYKTHTHQQMYYKWVERAFLGGLRLMVVHMVSNEALCTASKRRAGFSCNDMEAVDRQIQAVKDLERAIDRMDDNQVNRTGWYQIAYSPAQARDIIRSGKLAVVLGIEVDTLFGCKPGTPCSRPFIRGELQRYYAQGIRHVFPIHHFDNAYGGPAIFRNELNAGNAVVTNNHFQVRDCSADGYNYNVSTSLAADFLAWLLAGRPFPDQNYYDQFAADCNARGLQQAGHDLIDEMMDLKFIIDTDHMSAEMLAPVLDKARNTSPDRPNKYPLVSSHTSFRTQQTEKNEFSMTDETLAIFKEIGGMVTATKPSSDCGTTAQFRSSYMYAVNGMKSADNDPFAAVGFSTDMNGFGGATGPRFGNPACPGQAGTQLPYPFQGILGGSFNRQATGDRSFDFNTQGLAHYGLLADFFADLRQVGLTMAELDPLLNSAESYIRLWERVDASDRLPPPTITALVNGTEGLNGWYTSDVTVEWEVLPPPGVENVTLVGCGTTTIAADTGGQTLTCRASNPSGETSEASVTIRRDATPPTFVATRLTAANANGWNNGNVTVRFTAKDARSGVGGNPTADVQLTQEGANQTASATFSDLAGNTVEATFGGVNIDKTRPAVGFRFAHLPENATPAEIAAEQNRWHNQTITLLVNAQDSLSGVDSITPAQLVFSQEGTKLFGVATATDRAGNTVSDDSDPIKIDLTPPVITLLNRLPAANAFGWNNTPVTVNWECGDALSGPVAAMVSQTLASEGDDQTASQNCHDQAGNTAKSIVAGIRLDFTPPTVTFGMQSPPANVHGWNRTDVSLPFAATDALSGVASTSILSPLVLGAEGVAVNGNVSAADKAGNSADFTSPSVRIDKTAPSIAFVGRVPLANVNGWNNTDITATWACADGLSGVSAPTVAETLSTEGANQSLVGRCTDLADNFVTTTLGGLNLDKTPPLLQCVAGPPMLWPPNNRMEPVDVTLTFTDALAGTWSFAMTTASSNEPNGQNDIAGFAVGVPTLSGQLRASRLGSGSGRLYSLAYEGLDLAGNASVCTTGVSVPHDRRQ